MRIGMNGAPFAGAFPRISARKLQPNQATYAENYRLDSGSLRPWLGTNLKTTVSKAGTNQTIYRWAPTPGDENSGFWFHWPADVDVQRGPVNGDTEQRTYFTGDGSPKYTYAGIATTGGGSDYPINTRPLGVPIPSGSITCVITGTPDAGASPDLDVFTRVYCVVYVTEKGEWGPPGAFSAMTDVVLGEGVDLSAIPTAPGGSWVISSKRIYRLASGPAGEDYYFVDEIPIAQDTYSDTKYDSELGAAMISSQWYEPPTDMFGLGILPSGVAYGFSGNQICFSEPYLPHAWNPLNQLSTKTEIIGGAHVGDSVVVFDQERPYIVTGIDPAAMSVSEVNNQQSCMSKRSIVGTRYGVVYASPDGLIMIRSQGDDVNLTEAFFDEKAWRALQPETMLGAVYEGKYLCFYDDGTEQKAFLLDPMNPQAGLMYIDVHATGAFRDALTDKLYLIRNNNEIHEFNEGSALTGLWRSPEYVMPVPRKFNAARVLIESGTTTFRLFVDGVQVHSQAVSNNKPFRLPMVRGEIIQIELEGTGVVTDWEIAESMAELANG